MHLVLRAFRRDEPSMYCSANFVSDILINLILLDHILTLDLIQIQASYRKRYTLVYHLIYFFLIFMLFFSYKFFIM